MVAGIPSSLISSEISPPFRYRMPLLRVDSFPGRILSLIQLTNLGNEVTALPRTKSNCLLMFSARTGMLLTFLRSRSEAMDLTTFIFFAIESTRRNSLSGNRMAKGIPGKPPPVPTSRIFVFGANETTFKMERLGRRWRSIIVSVSLREIRLIF